MTRAHTVSINQVVSFFINIYFNSVSMIFITAKIGNYLLLSTLLQNIFFGHWLQAGFWFSTLANSNRINW